jgi:mannosyltransferase
MASGLPIIAVKAGALEELVTTHKNGFLCGPKDVEGVANGLDFLFRNPEKAKEMGVESRRIAKTHDLSHTLNRMEEIYKEVIKNHEESLYKEDED